LLLSPFSEIRRPWFCSGSEDDGSGRRLQRVLNLDAECIETWSSDYEVVGRMRGYPIPKLSRDADPQTTLVMANMGAGKSKELFNGLLPRLPADSSVCLIAPNIALARKYHEETKRRRLDFVCYLDEPGVTIGVLTTGPRLQNACNDAFLQPNYYTYSNSDHGCVLDVTKPR
jgi:hypothetical protein